MNARHDKGCTVLHLACSNGKMETVELMITTLKDFSIDLNDRDNVHDIIEDQGVKRAN